MQQQQWWHNGWETLCRILRHPPAYSADLYELTMAAGYLETRFEARATFELFVRSLPPKRNFLVIAGLQQALDFLDTVRFSAEDIAYLRRHPAFAGISASFFDYLAGFRFSGDVWALPEGTVCFPGEPLLRITAPIAESADYGNTRFRLPRSVFKR